MHNKAKSCTFSALATFCQPLFSTFLIQCVYNFLVSWFKIFFIIPVLTVSNKIQKIALSLSPISAIATDLSVSSAICFSVSEVLACSAENSYFSLSICLINFSLFNKPMVFVFIQLIFFMPLFRFGILIHDFSFKPFHLIHKLSISRNRLQKLQCGFIHISLSLK